MTSILKLIEELPPLTIKTRVMTTSGERVEVGWNHGGVPCSTLGIHLEDALRKAEYLEREFDEACSNQAEEACPAEWPQCSCGNPAMSGKKTCGSFECLEALNAAAAGDAWG